MPSRKPAATASDEPVRPIAGKPVGSVEARITLRNPLDVDDASKLVPPPTLQQIEAAIKVGLEMMMADKVGSKPWGVHVAASWTDAEEAGEADDEPLRDQLDQADATDDEPTEPDQGGG